mmetsp:Transcript_9370/g.8426  ORF Transcript_9370/g.8426 Transcript_9370/m.8426 type:complete len:347 (+) Transcript_9370:3-1043(+)
MSYIINNQVLSRVIDKDVNSFISDDDNDEQYQHKARRQSMEILNKIQDGMEALENNNNNEQHEKLVDDLNSADSNKEKDNDQIHDIDHEIEMDDDQDGDMLAGLMDELEDEFNGYIDDDDHDYNIHETDEHKQPTDALEIDASPAMKGLKGPFDITPSGSTVSMISGSSNIISRLPSIPSPIAGYSNGSAVTNKLDGLSVDAFKKILDKYFTEQKINADGVIKELDPSGDGVITVNAIGTFQRRLSEFKASDITILENISEASSSSSGDSKKITHSDSADVDNLENHGTIVLRARSNPNSIHSTGHSLKESTTDLVIDESDDDIDADLLVNELDEIEKMKSASFID